MKNVFFLKPYLDHEEWGSDHLKEYGIDLENATDVGEALVISAYQDKSSVITNGEYSNQTLYDVFNSHKELFDNYSEKQYPLCCKYIDCGWKLPVQVHPTHEYAQEHYEEAGGREKCWYVIKAEDKSNIVLGHTAKTIEEFRQMVKDDNWDKLLVNREIKSGELIYVPTGCIHGLSEGLILYEVQLTSTPVFKIYNYEKDSDDLNIEEAFANTTIPYREVEFKHEGNILIETDKFKLIKIINEREKEYSFTDARWIQATVIDGEGILNDEYELKKGISFIIPSIEQSFKVKGEITILISYVTK